ncbi:MAG: VWA domain-containing protein [Chloroflexota bacterium]
MALYRYTRWDGTQRVDFPDTQELADQLAERILDGHDVNSALRRMLQRGMELPNGKRMAGMQELLERLRNAREKNLQRYNLGSMMDDIAERLKQVVQTEREGIERRLNDAQGGSPKDQDGHEGQAGAPAGQRPQGDVQQGPEGGPPRSGQGEPNPGAPGQGGADGADDGLRELLRRMANRHLDQLDQLPTSTGGQVKALREYDFMDPEARRRFEELLEQLQKQVLQNTFQGLQKGIQNMDAEALRQASEMIQDLNKLMQEKLSGREPDISEFMAKWGHNFPPGIETFDQLMDHMQAQMAQMQALLNSMTSEQRRELEQLMEELLRDNRIQMDMAQMAALMEQLRPGSLSDVGRHFMGGDEPLSLEEALRVMGDLNGLDGLEEQLIKALRTNDPTAMDPEAMGRLLGQEAEAYARELQRVTKELEEAGLIKRNGRRWELTPHAVRRIGDKALADIFARIRGGQLGDHSRERAGLGVELEEETKPYEFGDALHLNAMKTVTNAVAREGAGTPVRITPDDFEVNRTTALARASTVIAIDMSYSMVATGFFQAGQRVGLALDTLIRTKYPKDQVTVMAFSYFVLPLASDMLLDTHWVEFGGGTNMQEVLRQARKMLGRQGGGTKQVILITDGEPSTYSDWTGPAAGPVGNYWGADAEEETLREVMRCTRDNITINTFMLSQDPALLRFVQRMSKLNKGRAFIASPNKLGTYVVADYINMKNKVVR